MNKSICATVSCANYGKYCRQHLTDEPKEMKTDTKEYLKVRAEFLKDHKTCQVGTCNKPAKEVHHKKGRGKKYLTDPRYFLATCPGHHKFITEHPIWARENGYSESRLTKTSI